MGWLERFGRPQLDSVSVAGTRWKLDTAAADEVRRLVIFLRDRRVLIEWDDYDEHYDDVVASVLKMRERIGKAREELPIRSETGSSLQRMRKACRQFLGAPDADVDRQALALRIAFATELEMLATHLGFDEAAELAATIREGDRAPPAFLDELRDTGGEA
jgi:hypothetical protein